MSYGNLSTRYGERITTKDNPILTDELKTDVLSVTEVSLLKVEIKNLGAHPLGVTIGTTVIASLAQGATAFGTFGEIITAYAVTDIDGVGGLSYDVKTESYSETPIQVQYSLGAVAGDNNCTNYRRVATADTNLAVIKATAGKIMSLFITNVSVAVKYVKLYDKATAPVLATDTPIFTFGIPAGQTPPFWSDGIGAYFATGIAIAITGAAGDTDETGLTAGDIIVNGTYI